MQSQLMSTNHRRGFPKNRCFGHLGEILEKNHKGIQVEINLKVGSLQSY